MGRRKKQMRQYWKRMEDENEGTKEILSPPPVFPDGLCASNNCKCPEELECYVIGKHGL
jgi:hypothetical protein